MSLREKLNENPMMVGVVVAVLVAVCAILAYRGLSGGGSGGPVRPGTQQAYYSEDDGRSYFAAPIDRIPGAFTGPGGGTAVLAVVLQYPGEKPFVGWLEKYTDKGQKLLREHYSQPANQGLPPPYTAELEREKLVKKPGEPEWVSVSRQAEQADAVRQLVRKNGEIPARLMPQ